MESGHDKFIKYFMETVKIYKRDFFIPFLIILLNLIIKGMFITQDAIAGDEPFSIHRSQLSISNIIHELSQGNNPPLYELILHFWTDIFGISPMAVRFPSLIFSSLTIIFIYKIGQRYLNKTIAIMASILFVFSNYQILYAHQSRVYALLAMLATISMYYYLKFTEDKVLKNKDLVIFVIAATLVIYAHYFGFFILFVQVLHLLLNRALFVKHWKQILMATAMIIILYLPNIQVLIYRFLDSSTHGTWVQPPNGLETLYNRLNAFNNAPIVNVVAIIVLILTLFKILIINRIHKISAAKQLMLIWFFVPFIFMFFISYWIPMFAGNYLMFLTVGYYISLAIAADYLIDNQRFKYIIPVLICVLYIATTKPNISNRRDFDEAVKKIIELKTPNSIVYICPSHYELNFLYYYDKAYFLSVKGGRFDSSKIYKYLNNQGIYPIEDQSQIDTSLIRQADKIIYLDAAADFSLPENGVLDKINENRRLKNKFKVYEIFNIYEYEVEE